MPDMDQSKYTDWLIHNKSTNHTSAHKKVKTNQWYVRTHPLPTQYIVPLYVLVS